MSDHIHTAPPVPSSRCATPIPPELDQLVLDCLAKDPAQRPASAQALQARLQAIPLSNPWTPERAEHWWSRHQPGKTSQRPIADVVLSQEARPVRVVRPARG
jgi:serine/threonine-protein kinase